MKILYIADPTSIHDVKWVGKLTEMGCRAVWLPRLHHQKGSHLVPQEAITCYISDFSIVRFWRTLATAKKIKRLLKTHNVDIIHIMYAEPNALWCNFRNYLDIPMVITSRGTDVLKTIPEAFSKKNLLNWMVAWLYKQAFHRADFVTGTSNRQLESVAKFSSRTDQIAIVRTGVDMPRLQANTSAYFPLADPSSFILFPRYIKPLYNHEFCLEAIAQLSHDLLSNYKMVFVGKGSGDDHYEQQLIRCMGNIPSAQIVFLPKQTQEAVFELYKRASVVVMTPLSDGSPVSALEAMVCGKPVILGPLEYDKDLFEGKVWQLKSWDSAELAHLINKALIEKLPQINQEDIARIDLNSNMEKVSRIYKHLVNT